MNALRFLGALLLGLLRQQSAPLHGHGRDARARQLGRRGVEPLQGLPGVLSQHGGGQAVAPLRGIVNQEP